MARYIDADLLIEKKWQAESEACFYALEDVVSVTDIDEAPTIDIVFCEECRWARPRTLKGETGYRCLFYRTEKAESGYCDCGERREE